MQQALFGVEIARKPVRAIVPRPEPFSCTGCPRYATCTEPCERMARELPPVDAGGHRDDFRLADRAGWVSEDGRRVEMDRIRGAFFRLAEKCVPDRLLKVGEAYYLDAQAESEIAASLSVDQSTVSRWRSRLIKAARRVGVRLDA